MKNSIKNFLLESESDKDNNFAYIKGDTIAKVHDVDFDRVDDYIKIDFSTTYKKKYSFVAKLTDFKNWLNGYLKGKEKSKNLFKDYLVNFFNSSKEADVKQIDEIIDDTNEIMPDQDIPSNATNRMVGANHTMDLEKIFKRSMPKSVRNYSGNLGLGTVVW
jgi:hypothetical protein